MDRIMTQVVNATWVNFNLSRNKYASSDTLPDVQRLSPSGYLVTGVILTVISVFGIFNNLSVVAVIVKNRALRTPVNLMLLSLSASDLIIAAFGTPLTASAAFAGMWYHGKALCATYGFFMALAGIASITTLAVISIERYVLVAHPGAVVITTRKTVLAIILVWSYALAVTFPPVAGWSSFTLESPGIACAPNWESSAPIDVSYEIYLFILGFVLPLGFIVGCYTKILCFIQQQAQNGAGQGAAKSQKKLTQMVALMVGCFLVAWLPYACVCIIVMAGGKHLISPTAATAPALLAKSSLIYNPVIYALMNPQLRNAFFSMMTCGRQPTTPQDVNRPRVLPTGFSNLQTSAATARPTSSIKKSISSIQPDRTSAAQS